MERTRLPSTPGWNRYPAALESDGISVLTMCRMRSDMPSSSSPTSARRSTGAMGDGPPTSSFYGGLEERQRDGLWVGWGQRTDRMRAHLDGRARGPAVRIAQRCVSPPARCGHSSRPAATETAVAWTSTQRTMLLKLRCWRGRPPRPPRRTPSSSWPSSRRRPPLRPEKGPGGRAPPQPQRRRRVAPRKPPAPPAAPPARPPPALRPSFPP